MSVRSAGRLEAMSGSLLPRLPQLSNLPLHGQRSQTAPCARRCGWHGGPDKAEVIVARIVRANRPSERRATPVLVQLSDICCVLSNVQLPRMLELPHLISA